MISIQSIWPGLWIPCILAGAATAQSNTIYQLGGAAAGDQFGEAVAGVGDLDGDGMADFVAASLKGAGGKGYVRAYSGATGVLLYEITGTAAGEAFGQALCDLGDLDGDNRSELLVGAPLATGTASGSGVAHVLSGKDGSRLWSLSGVSADDHFGWSGASIGDVTGDGVPELAVGAVDDDNAGNSSGSVRVVNGATGAELFTVSGTGGSQLFGWAIAPAGDQDGDKLPDFAVGAPRFTASSFAGYVRVLSGKDGALIRQIDGALAADRFGAALANMGDVEGDGLDDLLVGAPQPTGGKNGYVELHLAAGGPPLVQASGDSPNDRFGAAVAWIGDADDDGYPDLAVGAPGDDDLATNGGSVRLISSWTQQVIHTIHGETAGMELGSALSPLADVNADAKAEVLAACMGDSSTLSAAGCARVISTIALGLAADGHVLSIASPTQRALTIDFGSFVAGYDYLVLGSISGTSPGTFYGSLAVPLNKDRYYRFTRQKPNSAVLQGSSGKLDASGRALATFDPPSTSLGAKYLGLTFYHAAILSDPTSGAPLAVSNVVPVTLVP
jgi:hypothetical protein